MDVLSFVYADLRTTVAIFRKWNEMLHHRSENIPIFYEISIRIMLLHELASNLIRSPVIVDSEMNSGPDHFFARHMRPTTSHVEEGRKLRRGTPFSLNTPIYQRISMWVTISVLEVNIHFQTVLFLERPRPQKPIWIIAMRLVLNRWIVTSSTRHQCWENAESYYSKSSHIRE